jgi:sigma-E factor negative regulatory protein RseC
MSRKKGRVSRVDPNGWAMVITEKGDACSNCESAQFCHSLADCSRIETRVINKADARVGDSVSLSLNSRSILKSALILYLLPTVSLVVGAVGGAGLHGHIGIGETSGAILFGLVGLVIGFAAARLISGRQKISSALTPVIDRIIKPAEKFQTGENNYERQKIAAHCR